MLVMKTEVVKSMQKHIAVLTRADTKSRMRIALVSARHAGR